MSNTSLMETNTQGSKIIFDDDNAIVDNRPIVFQPNAGPQTDFLSAPQREVLYGGAAGGGKSYALLADALRDMANPNFNGLLVRRTTEELRELKSKSQQLYPKVFGKAIRWSEQSSTWRHVNGGTLWMSYLERDQDVSRYQGQSFTWVGFDELTQWPTPYCWDYLRSRLRSDDPSILLSLRATTNPGGLGHWWVKKMFIDPAPWGQSFWATDIETGETLVQPELKFFNRQWITNPEAGKPLFKRRFIPSSLSDNPFLYNSGDYEKMLMSLPEAQRKRLLEGNWDIMEGAAFTEWNRNIHVIEPFDIPNNWRKFRACDYGYGSHSGVVWFAVTPSDQLIIYRELYVHKVLATDLADMILDLEHDERISYGVLDSSLWHKRGDPGPSLAEQMIMRGCRWRPSDRSKGSRISGKNELHRRLQVDEFTDEPRLVVMSNCVNTIAQIPILPLDPTNPEDVDTKYKDDHLYDAIRYGIMSRPRSVSGYDQNTSRRYQPASEEFGY